MLVSKSIPINFASGLDTKTDPFQVSIGKFLSLKNSVFTTGDRLTKRNGFGALASLPYAASFATTFNGDLTALGTNIEAYSTGNKSWVNKGTIQPLTLSTLPLIRNSVNQSQCDCAVSANGLVCTVYTETTGTSVAYKYAIADAVTGQNIIAPTAISANATYGFPRVFALGNYFIIAYVNSTPAIAYIAVSTSNPSNVVGPNIISASHTPSTTVAWDAYVFSNNLYFAWNGGSSSGIKVAYLSSLLVASFVFNPDAAHVATIMSVTADTANSVIWASYYDSGTSTGYSLAMSPALTALANFPTEIISSGTVLNIASVALSGTATVFYEVSNSSNGTQCNYVQSVTVVQSTGVVGSPVTVLRSVGLASKAFLVGSTAYFYGVYSSPYQPTYFLVNGSTSTQASPVVIAKLAYENGGGYLTNGLPSVTFLGSTFYAAYLYKDLIEALADSNDAGTTIAGGIYSQTGINMAGVTLGSSTLSSAEIGSNLNITGGYLVGYDGYLPVENGFHLWPSSVQVSTNASAVTPTGTVANGSRVVTAVSSMVGVGIGASITGTAIPAATTIVSFTGNTITMSAAATGNHSAETITITGNIEAESAVYYAAIYSWSDNQGNIVRSAASIPVTVVTTGSTSTNKVIIPTLRITAKVANPVKIELYRWSTTYQNFYQVTSVTVPTLNSTTVDDVTIYDALASTSIVGNAILYTTGGVLENIGAPACTAVTLFDDRLWLIDAEDQNLLWNSKQVIENVPVEMSDLLTTYVAPSIGATGPTGPMRCLSAMDDKLIISKQNAFYYINGTGPDNTGANSQYSEPTFITSMVGCSNQNSIVFQPGGLMFEFATEAGNQIWLLGRDLSTSYIGAPVESLTKNANVLSAIAVPGTNEVRFNLSSGITLMYDYYFGQWGIFTTNALSSTLFQDLHTYIAPNGSVFQETPGLYLDGSTPVLMSFLTGWIQVQGISGYQRLWEIQLLGQYATPHLLNVTLGYDFGSYFEQIPIAPTNYTGAYGSDALYGQTTPYGGPGFLEEWRLQNSNQICQAFQVGLQELYDPTFGVSAGQGFSLSAMTCTLGLLRGYRPVKAANTAGSQG